MDFTEMFDDVIEIFRIAMLDLVNEVGNMILGILPQLLIGIGIFIAVNVGIGMINSLANGGIGAIAIGAMNADVELDDGIPDAPDSWHGDDEEWRRRWIRQQNEDVFRESYRSRND